MKPIAEFIPTAANVLRVGDVWDEMAPEARTAILVLTGQGWLGPSLRWIEIPAASRLEIAHRVYLFRDFLNGLLP